MTLPRLYPILDTETLARRSCPMETAARALLDGGAEIVQFRHKGHYSRAVFERVEHMEELCRDASALLIVNDRADIALLLDAGLHVGQEDLHPKDARRLLGAGRVLGFSTHSAAQMEAASGEPVDYLALGPVFATASKDKPDPALGIERFRQLRPITELPLVAIGGITRANALSVLEAGADSVAVIGDLYPEECTYESVLARMGQWQQLLK